MSVRPCRVSKSSLPARLGPVESSHVDLSPCPSIHSSICYNVSQMAARPRDARNTEYIDRILR